MRLPLLAAVLSTVACVSGGEVSEQHANLEAPKPFKLRGTLANTGFEGQPLKGVYFFPGEAADYNQDLYTAHPTLAEDLHWNSQPEARQRVVQRIVATHANTLVMSYWGDDMQRWSPMQLDESSVPATLAAVSGQPLLVVPSLESGYEPDADTYWRFGDDFPYHGPAADPGQLAPSLLARLRTVIALFRPHLQHWAQLYDREGTPRYAVQIMQVYAHAVPQVPDRTRDEVVAEAFDLVASELARSEGIEVGFLLDVVPKPAPQYSFRPQMGSTLERTDSVLAIAGFASEIFSGRVIASARNAAPIDNNLDNLAALLAWKREHLTTWVSTGVPVIQDVSSGFDGRFVWRDQGTFFWGDNYDYTFDDWRNGLSAQKGLGNLGITFNTWNGYTEGFAAVPTEEHGDTIYRWLTDLYAADPRTCSHVEYVDGQAGVSVVGAICEKWRDLGASRGSLGAPLEAERPSVRGRVAHFAHGSIFSSAAGVYEVHGAIHALYKELGYDASCLGLPVSDEEDSPSGSGRISYFEGGDILFEANEARSRCD